MRVVCDNCGASYKIPDTKLTREVNKATCRKCGHAIYIRKGAVEASAEAPAAPAGASEERTQIKSLQELERAAAAQPGPVPAESTIPRDEPVATPLDMGRAAPAPMSAADRDRPTVAAPPMPTTERVAPRPSPVLPPPPVVAPPPPPVAAPAPVAAAPQPSPAANARAGTFAAPAPAFEPTSDLTVALVGALVGIGGVLVLVASNVLVHSPVVGAAGAFLALFGMFLVLLILLTGGRGARKASLAVAVAGGFAIATMGAVLTAVGGFMLGQADAPLAAASPVPAAAVPAAATMAAPEPPKPEVVPVAEPIAAPEPPVAAAPPAEPVAAPTPAPTPAPVAAAPKPAPAAPAPKPAAPERIQPASKPASSTASTSRTSSSTPTTVSRTATPAPSSASTASSISLQVVDTMLRSNKGVKTCFINEMHDNGGAVPKGVKVKLTIDPSGKVTRASTQGDYSGTPFDSCLGSAIKSISFPPYEGDPVSLTYPFQT